MSELKPPRFPTMLRKMWSGGEVQAWIDENWNRRAQPAAPADAAPSVAPEPVAWQMIDKHGDTVYVPVTHAIKPDLVLDCDLRHPDNAPHEQRPLFAHPPRAPLTDAHVYAVVRSVQPHLDTTSKAWRDLVVECRYWLEAANGIGGK